MDIQITLKGGLMAKGLATPVLKEYATLMYKQFF